MDENDSYFFFSIVLVVICWLWFRLLRLIVGRGFLFFVFCCLGRVDFLDFWGLVVLICLWLFWIMYLFSLIFVGVIDLIVWRIFSEVWFLSIILWFVLLCIIICILDVFFGLMFNKVLFSFKFFGNCINLLGLNSIGVCLFIGLVFVR